MLLAGKQSLLPQALLAGEVSLRLQGRLAASEHLLPTATRAREGLILSQRESQPVISTLRCGVEKGGKRENYSRHSGEGILKGTPLGARQGYQIKD